MIRLIAIAALAATLGGCVTSPLAQKPAAQADTSLAAGHVGMPPSAPRNPNHCIHDEGYGRWTDCGSEM